MAPVSEFAAIHLRSICDVLADTDTGLTGSEISQLLSQMGIADPTLAATKRHRLFDALNARQQQDRCGNLVVAFIQGTMEPVRYTRNKEFFDRLREVLAFAGYSIGDDGKMRPQTAARTLTEAEERAGRLRAELRRRNVHPDVLAFCRAELLQSNYFHAVFEATKSVADKIRAKTGLTEDGAPLVDVAFGMGRAAMPYLAFNSLRTESEQSEHSGLMNLMKGMFGAFRNVTAHAPKISWTISEQDAFDLLTIASFLHRRLDAAVRTSRSAL
jgi:uncharacterized protein (TIGR02391 family)